LKSGVAAHVFCVLAAIPGRLKAGPSPHFIAA
jgi:hypothetical protein